MIPVTVLGRLACREAFKRRPTLESRRLATSVSAKQHSASRSGRRHGRNEGAEDERSERSRVRAKKGRARQTRVVEPKKFILPDIGLTARQLAALADASTERIFRCARELDDSINHEAALLSPALIELITEELLLNLRFTPQTKPLLTKRNESNLEMLTPRMPVLTVMGHVDHGKTSLLDALRNTDVAKKEFGGITQSVAAFQVPIRNGAKQDTEGIAEFATFIDTPGHAAFKAMRANGTVGTDLVILVIAADDGVMPQSIEAANLARAANVPIIVAINKCDAPGANPDRVRYQLVESLGINTEQLGGDVQCVDISAKTGKNLPQLLEAISLQAEMLDLRSDPKAPAAGICLESRVDRAYGSIATVVVRDGTLRLADYIVFQSPKAFHGDLFGRVRGLFGRDSEHLKEAGPGAAVGISGVREPIPPGAEFCVVPSEKDARAQSQVMILRNVEAMGTIELANSICKEAEAKQAEEMKSSNEDAVESTTSDIDAPEDKDDGIMRNVVVLIKADVKGSGDAVKQCIEALGTPQYPIRVVHVGVGDVTDADVKMASATRAAKNNNDLPVLIAFNVRIKTAEERHARRAGVQIFQHNIIYHLEDEVRKTLEKVHNENAVVEESLGRAAVVRVFDDGRIAGCAVEDGKLSEGDSAKVWRYPDVKSGKSEREVVFTGSVDSIKRFAKSVRYVDKGSECGIGLADWSGFMPGDVIECVVSRRQGEALT